VISLHAPCLHTRMDDQLLFCLPTCKSQTICGDRSLEIDQLQPGPMGVASWVPEFRAAYLYLVSSAAKVCWPSLTGSGPPHLGEPRYSGFKVWESKNIFKGQEFCFHYMFETNFSGHNKIWEEQKNLVGIVPKFPPWLRAWFNPHSPKRGDAPTWQTQFWLRNYCTSIVLTCELTNISFSGSIHSVTMLLFKTGNVLFVYASLISICYDRHKFYKECRSYEIIFRNKLLFKTGFFPNEILNKYTRWKKTTTPFL